MKKKKKSVNFVSKCKKVERKERVLNDQLLIDISSNYNVSKWWKFNL